MPPASSACLNALGNGNLTFTREQLNNLTFAQIHADRVVGAPCIIADGPNFSSSASSVSSLSALSTLDSLVQLGHYIFDLIRDQLS